MNRIVLIGFLINSILPHAISQELPASTEQQLEDLADSEESPNEDDFYWQLLQQYRKQPLNLNKAGEQELKELTLLSDSQVENLLNYRLLLGELVSIYELQAIPGWDLATIKKILPFVTVSKEPTLLEAWKERLKKGEHSLLLRISQVAEKAKGYSRQDTSGYEGSPQRILFRYRFTYKNLLQFGLLGEKDAGEPFLKGRQRTGFDFYSFHFLARNSGIIQAVALGDFSINIGQGLIHWQSMAFKKSPEVLAVKRQSSFVRPYNSAGEFNFHRGAALSIARRKLMASCFISFRKLSVHTDVDSSGITRFFTSFTISGNHRTRNEIANRHNLDQFVAGASFSYKAKKGYISVNSLGYRFSIPFQKREEPYNLYAIRGKTWFNGSVDYGLTFRNLHLFGEIATDKGFSLALLNGLLITLDPKIDLVLVYRNLSPAFQSLYSNAFTENTMPANEQGLYLGISMSPYPRWKFNAFADIFYFPWLRYRVDAPSAGSEYCMQLSIQPDKKCELYFRWRQEWKELNQPDLQSRTNQLVKINRQSWRIQVNQELNPRFMIRNRVELTGYGSKTDLASQGFLAFSEVIYKSINFPYSWNLRLAWFETTDYNSRIYAHENDVLFDNSIPAFFDRGFRYYMVFRYQPGKKFSVWIRWSQTMTPGSASIGSGLDEIHSPRKSEIKFQFLYII